MERRWLCRFGVANIWIWDLVRKTMTRLTFDADFYDFPLWTPDGKRIAFLSQREREYKVYWKASNGTGTEDPLGSVPSRWDVFSIDLVGRWEEPGLDYVESSGTRYKAF